VYPLSLNLNVFRNATSSKPNDDLHEDTSKPKLSFNQLKNLGRFMEALSAQELPNAQEPLASMQKSGGHNDPGRQTSLSLNNVNIDSDLLHVQVLTFACDTGFTTLHYTLVCDYVPDCEDRSDESFCVHAPCNQFTCNSGQCVSFSKACDRMVNCLDGLDEEDCSDEQKIFNMR
jgi:hypothetical protein